MNELLRTERFRFIPKGGRELPDDIRQKVQTDGSLVISPVQKTTDSGVYTCWARNKQGHSARRSGEVTVIGKKWGPWICRSAVIDFAHFLAGYS